MFHGYAYLCTTCVPGAARRSEEGFGSPGIEVPIGCKPLGGCCELNPGPLEEQPAFLTADWPPCCHTARDDLEMLVSGSPLSELWGGRQNAAPGTRKLTEAQVKPRAGAELSERLGRADGSGRGLAIRVPQARWLSCQAVCRHGGALGVSDGGGFAHRLDLLPDSQPGSGGSR